MVMVLVFGDSIAYGAYDRMGGWAQRLRMALDRRTREDENFYATVYNLSTDGATADTLTMRFQNEMQARYSQSEKTVVIFAVGINDAQYVHSQDSLRCPPDIFTENIKNLLSVAKGFTQGESIVFIGLTPVDQRRVDPIPWTVDYSYRNKDIEQYSNMIRDVCLQNHIHFVNLYAVLSDPKARWNMRLEDGVHPNTRGHILIFQIVEDYLNKNKILD